MAARRGGDAERGRSWRGHAGARDGSARGEARLGGHPSRSRSLQLRDGNPRALARHRRQCAVARRPCAVALRRHGGLHDQRRRRLAQHRVRRRQHRFRRQDRPRPGAARRRGPVELAVAVHSRPEERVPARWQPAALPAAELRCRVSRALAHWRGGAAEQHVGNTRHLQRGVRHRAEGLRAAGADRGLGIHALQLAGAPHRARSDRRVPAARQRDGDRSVAHVRVADLRQRQADHVLRELHVAVHQLRRRQRRGRCRRTH